MSSVLIDVSVIISAVIINNGLGTIWYSQFLFGTEWAKAHHFNQAELKPSSWHFSGALLVSFITVLVFYLLIRWFNLSTFAEGIKLGFLLWLGFVATTHFSGVIWAKKPLKVYLIDTGFQLVSLLVIGTILTLMRTTLIAS